MDSKMRERIKAGESVFTGNMFETVGIDFAVTFLNMISFGLASPWTYCWQWSWSAEHTYIDGKQLDFDGTGSEFFGTWLKWWLLSLVTLGIYGLWIPVKTEQWRVQHTHHCDSHEVRDHTDVKPGRKTTCPRCKTALNSEALFCYACGASLTGSRGDGTEPPIHEHRLCPKCNRKNAKDAMFCRFCGVKMDGGSTPSVTPGKTDRRAICPHCGARQGADAVICKYCGTRMR